MTSTDCWRAIRLAFALLILACIPACGGGGGGAAPAGPALLQFLQAVLRGDAETSVVDPDARATCLLDIQPDGTLAFGCTVDVAWASQVTGMHIHRGAAGEDGPVEVDLLSDGAVFDPSLATASDSFMIDVALAAEIAAAPDGFYVNIHTGAAPGGFVRGQLAAMQTDEIHARLSGEDETMVVQPTARGACSLQVEADATLSWQLAMHAPAIADIQNAHVHPGAAGVDGSISIDLDVAGGALDPVTGLRSGVVTPNLRTLARLQHAPEAFYVNVHTAAAPAGVARGQLGRGTVELWSHLKGADVILPPVDPTGRGGVTLQLRSFTEGTAHLAVPTSQGIDNLTMAHVHAGTAGVDGPMVIDLMGGADFGLSPLSFSAEGSITFDRGVFTRLLADPEAFHVDFHTAADPDGAVRGQLSQRPIQFEAVLDGSEEITVVDPSAGGRAVLVVPDVFSCAFSIHMDNPAAASITAAHVHDGAAGADGPVLIDLLGGFDVAVSGDDITGDAEFSGRTFARLIAFAERFYVNVHTGVAPAGIARGQLLLRDESIPPAGLSYATPVVYSEGVAITPNVPSVGGGAVASYAIVPPLPAGLVLDPLTGVISGTPTVTSPSTTYLVTGTNASGSTNTTLDITVQPEPPVNLAYQSPVTYTVGTEIAPNTPTHDGGAVSSFGVSPALPAGLALHATTGVISGTPTSASGAALYTVTAMNAAGSTTFGITITVNSSLQPPSGLSYDTPVSYPTGYAITPNVATLGGGAVSSWSISPVLPAGLQFNTANGDITGTPTSTSTATNYTVTAANAAGSTNTMVNLTVTLGAPSSLSYSGTNPLIGYKDTAISPPINPMVSGGAVSSWSITPALPAGMTFSTTTGAIGGTPTVPSALSTHTVTATNATGSTTTTIQVIVY